MDVITQKSTGSFYTCSSIADYIANWAIETPNTCVLEPSFGDGIFIDSAISRFKVLGNSTPNIIGVEIQEQPYNLYIESHAQIQGFCMDFMEYRPNTEINAIIGNPPYVRLKELKAHNREKVLQLLSAYGLEMQTSGSLWMPFIVHSTEILEDKGKLGFVLPYEITHVRYAMDLWEYLSAKYGKITICRIYHDFFPDVDVETIVLLAEEKGSKTNAVFYTVFETIADLFNNNACLTSKIPMADIVNFNKPFVRELIPQSVMITLESLRKSAKLTTFVHDCKFKIGYVSGNKDYFHLSEEEAKRFNIHKENLRKCLLNAKQINSNVNSGIETATISKYSFLFYPVTIDVREWRYIGYGEEKGVDKGYKCKARKPWYLTPGLEMPDIILTVFGDVPKMLLNNGSFYVSNSLLSGFLKNGNKKELICRWYNSLTLLSVEMTIHSLGGGTLVLIPGETDKLEIISNFPVGKVEETYRVISDYARIHSTEELYLFGDEVVLKKIYGFSDETIDNIRKSLQILRNWRNPDKRRR